MIQNVARGPALPVTAHAVLRYLTRIEGFNLRPLVTALGRGAGNFALAQAAADSIGVSYQELQRRICPEHLAGPVRAGAARIRRDGMVLICKNGMVVTIAEELRHRSIKVLSHREIKRGLQRRDRRR